MLTCWITNLSKRMAWWRSPRSLRKVVKNRVGSKSVILLCTEVQVHVIVLKYKYFVIKKIPVRFIKHKSYKFLYIHINEYILANFVMILADKYYLPNNIITKFARMYIQYVTFDQIQCTWYFSSTLGLRVLLGLVDIQMFPPPDHIFTNWQASTRLPIGEYAAGRREHLNIRRIRRD